MPAEDPTRPRTEPRLAGTVGFFRPFGVPLRLHVTFVLLVVFLIYYGLRGKQSALADALYVLALFASVTLHEFAHAGVSYLYGIKTLEVVMYPVGGVARLERAPKAREELWIALAGPLLNLCVAGGVLGVLAWQGKLVALRALREPLDANLWQRIAVGNLALALFNLLPAYPMDGGRILRSILALYLPEDAATRTAARAGRYLAGAMGLYGLLTMNFLLVFVAFFVYAGAAQEGAAAMGRSLTQGVPVRAAMVTDFRTLAHGGTIRDAAAALLATSQQDFPVVHGGQVIGLLGRSALLRAMALDGPDVFIAGVMNRDFVRLSPDSDLAEALPLLARAGSCALVMDGDRLVGLLTAENLSEFLLLRRIGMQPEKLPRQP